MKGIFHPDKRYDWESTGLSLGEIRGLDPEEDRYYREYIVLHLRSPRRERLMQRLGIRELPEEMVNIDDPSDELYWEYIVLNEQVEREPDAEVLKEAVYEASGQMARFAFCRLTKYSYPWPECDAYSYRTYECGWKEGMTTEEVVEFCHEMIAVCGPFAKEAKEILADPPKDHNDYAGKRMISHERAMSEPPYVRRERLAPFRSSEKYEEDRAEVLDLEARGLEALAAGDKEKAMLLFWNMSRKSQELGKYTQRWDALDDYARSLILMAEVDEFANEAEEAAVILRRLVRECPEERTYREHLARAEAVFRSRIGDGSFSVKKSTEKEPSPE